MDELTVKPDIEMSDDMIVTSVDISDLVTEDDTPVDNILSEKQMRLLTESLYASWPGPGDGRTFVAMANVGLFYMVHTPAIVPDVLVAVDVQMPDDLDQKENRSYFVWQFGKPPDVVIEIVSNNKGEELGNKLLDYARIGVGCYVVFDPYHYLGEQTLRIFSRVANDFTETQEPWLRGVKLGLTLWDGEYEGMRLTWLRWQDQQGGLIPTGAEAKAAALQRAEAERQRAEGERQRAEEERQRAEGEHRRAERLAARLRELGIDPDA
jgi:hypothetical protein